MLYLAVIMLLMIHCLVLFPLCVGVLCLVLGFVYSTRCPFQFYNNRDGDE